ncbi:MAG: lysophospholipid acyltransferase family protein [Rhizobiales bacterium]|jgi:lysophospholipid acyltransferase (LPLAT)-like uncharacterized protein|nr:lysophospholipid acyltransferase family protein [Hyphomicrobiales bacterium]
MLIRRLTRSPAVQRASGLAAAHYLRLVWHTTRLTIEPPDAYDRIPKHAPIILAMWHGQHFLMPFVKPPGQKAKVLISRHRDGEINAVAAERLGIGTIRGSGSHGNDFSRKGGVFAFNAIVGALNDGWNVALTADVPKVARVAGLGIIKIAQVSGRPIYPMAIATRRRIVLDNWDRTTINLPFGRGGGVAGAPIHVPADASAETLELARVALEESLNAVTGRAYELADGQAGGDPHG